MNITDLFIRRPVLALVVNLVILIAGLQAIRTLNVRQYPRSENAAVTVTTVYVGASAEPGARLHHHAAGAGHRRGRRHRLHGSQSTLGLSTISVRLKLNYDATKALAEISSKVDQVRKRPAARGRGPGHQHRVGRQPVRLGLPELHLGHPQAERDHRLPGARRPAAPFGHPRACSGPTSSAPAPSPCASGSSRTGWPPSTSARPRSRQALAANNFLAALGKTKGALIQVNLTANTDLHTVEEFKQLVVREQNGAIVRLGDIADVVLGAEDYDTEVHFSGQTAVFMGIWPLPNANSLDVIKRVRTEMDAIQQDLPSGMQARIAYDATDYITNAIHEVLNTLGDTLLIVMVVIFLFLGSFRSVLIPVVAIPVSLIGARLPHAGLRLHGQPADPAGRSCSRSVWWSTTPSWWWRTSSATWARGNPPWRRPCWAPASWSARSSP